MLSQNKKAVSLISLGSLTWILTMIKSGLPTNWGIGFWGANGHDAIWHLSLSNSLGSYPFKVPVLSGYGLQNYHVGFDYILHYLSKTGISPSLWYFQILPIVFSLLVGVLTFVFVSEWKNKKAAIWSVFFVYFGGGFGWIVTLLRGQGIGGESMFWSQQSISTLINPPFALSLILLMSGMILLNKYLKKQNTKLLVFLTIAWGILIEIKAYAGVLTICALLGGLFLNLLFTKSKKLALPLSLVTIGIVLLAVVFLTGIVPTSGNLFKFEPGWFLDTMLGLSDRFYWPKLADALFNWRSGHIYIKAIPGYTLAFAIFLIGNFGTRAIMIFQKFKLNLLDYILLLMLLGGVLAPMLFVQEGTAWNTIQFFYYSLFIASLYAGEGASTLLEKFKNNKKIGIVLLSLLTIPTTFSTLAIVYIPSRPPAVIPFEEKEALTFLSKQPNGVVLTYPFDAFKAKDAEANPPRPLYLYDSTAYVSAFADKDIFLEDEVNLTIMGYPWKDRKEEEENFYKELDQKKAQEFLLKNDIRYVYWIKPQRAALGETQLGLKNIFENKAVVIYEVNLPNSK